VAKRLRKMGIHQTVLTELGQRIIGGEYDATGLLPSEMTLGEGFGVSRTVLREVMRVLSEKGLVEARPKIGTRILPRGQWDLLDEEVLDWHLELGDMSLIARDLVEARSAIEPEAAAHAAERRSEQELKWLNDAFNEMVENVDEKEIFVRSDLRFHEGILEASKNELFKRMAHAIRAALAISRMITVRRAGSSKQSLGLHQDVLKAISMQQPERARAAMKKLVTSSAADINAVLNARPKRKGRQTK
jgi:GntR family transcriptional regulator, galactonate operon transcriptional repressor